MLWFSLSRILIFYYEGLVIMIRAINLADNSENEIGVRELQSLMLEGLWLEIVDPTSKELAAVSEKSGIPVNFLSLPETGNVINLRLEPDFGIINFVVLAEIFNTKMIYPLTIAFSKNFLITVAKKEVQKIFGFAKERMHKVKIDPPSLVAYYILDEIVSDHFSHLEKIERLTAGLEEEIIEKTDAATVRRVFRMKSRLTSFNKILWYERGLVFNLKKCGAVCVSARARSLFDTTHEYLTRQIDIVETYREILSDAINAYLSTVSNKINNSIKNLTIVIFYLTIVTTITSFPNTVATFFGIAQFGYTNYIVIFTVLLLSIILPLLWLWRRKWLHYEKLKAMT